MRPEAPLRGYIPSAGAGVEQQPLEGALPMVSAGAEPGATNQGFVDTDLAKLSHDTH